MFYLLFQSKQLLLQKSKIISSFNQPVAPDFQVHIHPAPGTWSRGVYVRPPADLIGLVQCLTGIMGSAVSFPDAPLSNPSWGPRVTFIPHADL